MKFDSIVSINSPSMQIIIPFDLSFFNKKIDQTSRINSQVNDKFLAFTTL